MSAPTKSTSGHLDASVLDALTPDQLELLDAVALTTFASLVREMWQRQDGEDGGAELFESYATVADQSYLAAWHLLMARRRFRGSAPPPG